MIPPLSGGAMMAPLASPPACAAEPPAGPRDPATGFAGPSGDGSLDKLIELLGDAPMRRLYADGDGTTGGASGGGRSVRQADPLVGIELPGQKGVVIQRSFGDPKGYETRNHALAWARAMGSEHAMVVQGRDKRWHAVETSQTGRSVAGSKGSVLEAVQVGKVDPAVYDDLRRQATARNDPEKWKDFASYALGVPRDEIHVVSGGQEPSREKLNINLTRGFDAEGRVGGFDPKRPPWVQLGPAAFDRPANACATLAHEETHADHHRMAKGLHDQYLNQRDGRPKTVDGFRRWVMAEADQTARSHRADPAKAFDAYRRAEVVAGMVDSTFAATELEAHVEAARLAFASGDLVQARIDLGKVANRPVMPSLQTQQVSIATLRELKASLAGDALQVFVDVARSAPANNVLHDARLRSR